MTILKADFLKIADSMAAQSQELAKEMGTGVEAGTASLGAQNNIGIIMSPLAEDVVEDLLEAFRDQLGKMTTYPNAYSEHEVGMKALNRHTGGINTYLTAQAARVAPEFKWAIEMLAIESLDPANTFSPVVDPMDTVEITGLDAATWVDITDIDSDNYYQSPLELVKTTAAGAADPINFTIRYTFFDGTTSDQITTVDASDAIDTVDLLPQEAIAVTLVSVTCGAGSAGQAWKVRSKLERVVVL